MSQLAAVVWDVDGTLAETERDGHRVAFNRAFEALGVPWRWDVARYGELLHRLDWVSLGGGISFTSPGYALDAFCERLRRFAQTYALTVYLEPGAAVVRQAATLEVSVVSCACTSPC